MTTKYYILDKETFINQAQLVHGNRYDYSETVYTHSKTKVKIGCREHGLFEQEPNSHLKGRGCAVCAYEAKAKTQAAQAKSEFATKASIVHNSKYTYELVEYKNNKTKVRISCPSHGSWQQTPNNHLRGSDCPQCAASLNIGWTRTGFKQKCIQNNNGLGILYVLECFNNSEHFFKIGITSRSVQKRYNTKVKMPYAYRIIDEIIGDSEFIYDLETEIHKQHKEHHYEPLIPFGGSSTECFKSYNKEDIYE